MDRIRIILAESSDIMLHGLYHSLLSDPAIEVCAKARRYNVLCRLISEMHPQLVVLGPMIRQLYSPRMKHSLQIKFPGIPVVEISLDDQQAMLPGKIRQEKEKISIGTS